LIFFADNFIFLATITRFEDLEIWQLARQQSLDIFEISKSKQFCSDFSLINQMNSSAGSVMDNIAEGFERFSKKEFIQFLVIAKGSNGEVRSQLYRAFDKNFITKEILVKRLQFSNIIGNKLFSFIRYLSRSEFTHKPLEHSNIQHPTPNFKR
jgi:four helix bundle protein